MSIGDYSNLLMAGDTKNKNQFSSQFGGNQPIDMSTDWGAMNNFSTDVDTDMSNIGGSGAAPEFTTGQWWLGGKNKGTGMSIGGMASPLLQTATAGMNAYLGLKQLGMMQDSLDFQKESFSKQFEAQKTTLNTELKDRQNARNASGSGYESTDSYMANNAVK